MSLLDLPHDILICVLSDLDIPTVFKCQRVCKQLKQAADSEFLHKSFSHRAGWLAKGDTLDDLRKPIAIKNRDHTTSLPSCRSDGNQYSALRLSGRNDEEIASYKAYVASSWKLEFTRRNADLSFAGGTNYSPQSAPKSIKIDHIDNIMIVATSGPTGGLHFVDMNTGATLNPERRPCLASGGVEFDQGWLAYLNSPEVVQISCFERCSSVDEPRRGYLTDCGQIKLKHFHAKHKLHFPHLLVGSDAGTASMFDVKTQECVLEVTLEKKPARRIVAVSCVEFDDEFIFVALATGEPFGVVQVYCRKTGRYLREISHRTSAFQGAATYQFMADFDDDGNPKCPGWGLQYVDTVEEYLNANELGCWSAVQPDHKTGSLILLWGTSIVIIPHYRELCNRDENKDVEDPMRFLKRATILADGSFEPQWDLPGWAQQREYIPQHCLSVADGRAAISAKNGVAVIDLAAFAGFITNWDDPRRLYTHRASSYEVTVYGAPHVYKAHMHGLTTLALTPTCLAWAGSFVGTEPHAVSESLRNQCGVEQIYRGEYLTSLFWIDFGKLRDKRPDLKRQEEEQRRLQCLTACKKEMDRRIAASESGKYVLQSGREINDIGKHYKDPLDMAGLLLSLGEFADESRWVDWEAVERKEGSKAAADSLKRRCDVPQPRVRALDTPRLHYLVDGDGNRGNSQSSAVPAENGGAPPLDVGAIAGMMEMGADGSFYFTLPAHVAVTILAGGLDDDDVDLDEEYDVEIVDSEFEGELEDGYEDEEMEVADDTDGSGDGTQ